MCLQDPVELSYMLEAFETQVRQLREWSFRQSDQHLFQESSGHLDAPRLVRKVIEGLAVPATTGKWIVVLHVFAQDDD